MADKIVDISQVRKQKNHERREEKLKSIKERFAKAMGMEDKVKAQRSAWKKRKKSKPKPGPEGW